MNAVLFVAALLLAAVLYLARMPGSGVGFVCRSVFFVSFVMCACALGS